MEFNSGVSMFLPDAIGLNGNDFDEEDHEDIVHEQTNQNEIVELIMAAFEGHEEPSDGEEEDEDDDEDENESLNTSNSSQHLQAEHAGLNTNNNNNNHLEHFHSQPQNSHDVLHRNHLYQQPLYSTPAVSTPPPLVPPSASTDVRRFDDYTHSRYDEQDLGYHSKMSALVRYQNPQRSSSANAASANVQYFDTLPTLDITDPLQNQFLYQNSSDMQNQLNKYRILCNVKDRKISELENRCAEYHEKYNSDLRVLKHKIELAERAKYDSDQRYKSITGQCEELIQTNNQLQRTVKDTELRIQQLETTKSQLEKKLDEAESLIDSLHRKVNELQRFESIARTQQDCELILSSTREKHEQELINVNEKLQMTQMNLQEKATEVDELRVQLDSACRTNEKAIFERMETINHLNHQLLECQKQYSDLLTNKSSDTMHQLTRLSEEKEKLEQTCEELQSEIRTLRERLGTAEQEVNKDLFGISHISVNEISSMNRQVVPHNSTSYDNPNESLVDENQHLKERIDEYASNEKNLIELNEDLQRQIQELASKMNTSTSEVAISNTVHMEQIHSLTNALDKQKKGYGDLKDKYEYEKQELQTIIEQLREDIVDVDKTKQLYIDVCQEKNSIEDKLRAKFEYEIKMKLDDLHRNLEKDHQERLTQSKCALEQENHEFKAKFEQDIERMKLKHEKTINELNMQLDQLRANDDAKSRLVYIEKEFEQLKHDYSDLNGKQKELVHHCKALEDESQNLLHTIEQINEEKAALRESSAKSERRFSEELLQLNQRLEQQKQQDEKLSLEALQTRINNYENAVSQYEEYRLKLEANLQKISQQRDAHKMDLRLTKEMLTNKENEFNQLQKQFAEANQTLQEKEIEYREKILAIENDKTQLETRLQEANRALSLADAHLKQEIEKIKSSLEQEYSRRYERDQKQHQSELTQLRQQLTSEFDLEKKSIPSEQDIEEMKKMYRTEIDRLYRENSEVNQNQAKLIDAHQKQMQILKKDLDDSYNSIINEFQSEQARLQDRHEQLKHQFNESQQTIEQLNQTHFEELAKLREKVILEQDNRNRQENLQNRVDHLVRLLEQSNDTLNEERTLHAQQESEYQQTISSLQKKIADMIKQHTKAMDEIKRDLNQERLAAQKRLANKPICVPEYVQTDLSINDYMATIEKLRVGIAHYMDNLDFSIKKQLQNELARSRNSMIQEIRRELFEKITHAMTSQGVPDATIDTHIFELDRLLSQMAQDCLDSLASPSSTTVSIYATLPSHSSLSTPQRQLAKSIIYESTSTSNLSKLKTPESATPLRKSIECLHLTPVNHKQAAPLAPHCHPSLDSDRRPKSASTILLAGQSSSSTAGVMSPRTHKFQRPNNRHLKMKMCRSEDDIMLAMQRQDEQQQQQTTQYFDLIEDPETVTLCENEDSSPQHQQPNVRALARQFEQKTGSLPEHSRAKLKSPDQLVHHAAARTIINEQPEDIDEEESTWPQQPPQLPNQSSGIKKFVRHGLKLFNNNKTKRSENN